LLRALEFRFSFFVVPTDAKSIVEGVRAHDAVLSDSITSSWRQAEKEGHTMFWDIIQSRGQAQVKPS
jgi:hypothetical protein